MPRSRFLVLRTMIGAAVILQIAPCMARQAGSAFLKAIPSRAADFPASTGRFLPVRSPTERSGPVDLSAAATIPAPSTWRMCRACGYVQDVKPVGIMSFRPNFQPIGGTISYRF